MARRAAESTGGYPVLIQLAGYFLWREAQTTVGPVTSEMVGRAAEAAGRRNVRMVIEAALANVSALDLEFLRAMSEDEGPSASGDVPGPRGYLRNRPS